MGKGAFLGKESTLADSGWAGVIVAGVGQVRKAAFSASWQRESRDGRMGY